MRFKLLFIFYFKNILKSKLYLWACLLFFLILITRIVIIYFLNEHLEEDFGNLPADVSVSVQMISILYIIYFYRSYSNELLYGVHSFFSDGYKILLEKMSAMLTSHSVVQGLMFIITYFIYCIFYLFVGIELSDIYFSLFRFLFHYMFVPLLFCLFYGLIIAMLFGARKSSIVAILFLWIVTSSMGSQLFENFFSTVKANEWKSLIFLGMSNIMIVYKSYTGFDVMIGNELKALTWLFILIGMILIISLRWAQRPKEFKHVLSIGLSLFLISPLIAYYAVKLNAKYFYYGDYIAETNLYENMQQVKSDLRYEIDTYHIELDENEITVQMTFNYMDTLEPTFQLYHAYPIQSIEAGDETIRYERHGDIIKLKLPTDQRSLSFHYEIVDTHYMPYVNGRVALLADKAWYPKRNELHTYERDIFAGGVEISETFFSDEQYYFTLHTEDVLFCNIPLTNEGVYSGNTQALSVIKGQGNQLTYEDYEITYPADWPNMETRITTVIPILEMTLDEVRKIAPTKITNLPKQILFSDYSQDPFLTKDHLLYSHNTALPIHDEIMGYDAQYKMLQLLVERKKPLKLHEEWMNLSSQIIRENNDLSIDIRGSSGNHILSRVDEERLEHISQILFSFDTELRYRFLREWYEKMNENWTFDDVVDLVEELNTDVD